MFDQFLKAYIVAALWSSCDDEGPLDERFDQGDLAPATLTQMQEDCKAFYEETATAAAIGMGIGAIMEMF